MNINEVVICGVIEEKKDDYCLLICRASRKKKDIIQVWNVPESVEMGKEIMIKGKLELKTLSDRHIFGICVEEAYESEYREEYAKISGIITKKSELRIINEKDFIHLTVKFDDEVSIQTVFWSESANYVWDNFDEGDEVLITGRVYSRRYVQVYSGEDKKHTTTQLFGREIEKIEINKA